MVSEKLTQLLVLRQKMLTQQLTAICLCYQPFPAVGALDLKVILLLRSFCTVEQALHKAQSSLSDSYCRKYH